VRGPFDRDSSLSRTAVAPLDYETANVALQRHALARVRPVTATDRSRTEYQGNTNRKRECWAVQVRRVIARAPGACRAPVTNRVPIFAWQFGDRELNPPSEIRSASRGIESSAFAGPGEKFTTNRSSVEHSALFPLGYFSSAAKPSVPCLSSCLISIGLPARRIAINRAEPCDCDLVGGLPSMRNVGQAPDAGRF
jgi:hypothetical protein